MLHFLGEDLCHALFDNLYWIRRGTSVADENRCLRHFICSGRLGHAEASNPLWPGKYHTLGKSTYSGCVENSNSSSEWVGTLAIQVACQVI